MDQVIDACFSSCRYVDCVVSGERQCLYDSRCDISDIDEVPRLIAIATDGMDDCRKMMPGKGQVECSTMLAVNQPLPVRLIGNLAGALVYIRYMVGMLCAYISFRYSRKDGPRSFPLKAYSTVYQNLNVSLRPSHC